MASPPYAHSPTALSPPAATPTPTSKKRSIDAAGQPPSLKRRKASTLSVASASSAHPLRQTSFPPPESGLSPFARSPSADIDGLSHVSGSQVSGPGGAGSAIMPKKKRGRKAKNAAAAANADANGTLSKEQTPSLVGGRAPTNVSGAGGDKDAQGAAEDDDEGDDGQLALVDENARTQEQKQEETRLRAMLVQAMDKEQEQRFEVWRASKLPDAVVRRIVNATVSQSVPANVVLAVRSVAKVYIGQIIESARRVQTEWIERTGEIQADVPEPPPAEDDEDATSSPRVGPLRPDHLREALWRYKRSGEGGGVGLQALWHAQQQDGVERFSTRTGGKRLFK